MKNCLIVDDSKVVRTFTKRILEELGFSTSEAEHGLDALEKCKAATPDFIMLDWNMPKMNGIEFLRELRKVEAYQKIPVIFCTTESEISKITEAIGSGASEYIMKPFDAEILKAKLVQTGILNAE